MLKPGDEAPDFSLEDQTGQTTTLSELLQNGTVVLFFYPAAMTFGCTRESCHFRDLATEFADAGAQRIGISADPVTKQALFDNKNSLGFPLLSDVSRDVASAYGAKRPGPLMSRRVTFVIGTDRKIIDVISSELKWNDHADRALRAVSRSQ